MGENVALSRIRLTCGVSVDLQQLSEFLDLQDTTPLQQRTRNTTSCPWVRISSPGGRISHGDLAARPGSQRALRSPSLSPFGRG